MGLGCAALGDNASAALEFDNARGDLRVAGSGARSAAVRELTGEPAGRVRCRPASWRCWRLVAEGKTSREIASSLTISQHTVRRHLENTFAKLGVNSRAAAIAYAYEHDLL